MTQRIISFDSTILNDIQLCSRKAYYKHILNVRTPEKPEAMEKGDLMHKMLEIYGGLVGNCARQDSTVYLELQECGLCPFAPTKNLSNTDFLNATIQFAVQCGTYFATHMGLPTEEVEETIFQFKEYCSFYANDPWQILAVEEVGSKLLYEDESYKIIYNFKIDAVRQMGNIIAPFDYKTSKKRKEPLDLSNQFIGYCYGLGVQHMVVDKIGFQKTLKPKERFLRYTLTYDEERIQEWVENSIGWAMEWDKRVQNESFPMNLTSCDKYSGCEFSGVEGHKGICDRPPSGRAWALERDYKKEDHWDVAAILEAKS